MNKRTIITYTILALVLLGGILALIFSLYGDNAGKSASQTEGEAASRYSILAAIPSDASAVMHFESSKLCIESLCDETKLFSAFIYDGKKGGMPGFVSLLEQGLEQGTLAQIKSLPMAVSLHYSGSLVPMAVLSLPRSSADSTGVVLTLRNLADSCSLASSFKSSGSDKYLMVSSSETLVSSSIRHIDEGVSILSKRDFLDCAEESSGANTLFFCNAYSQKLLQSFFTGKLSRHSAFFGKLSNWLALSIDSSRDDYLHMSGVLSAGKDKDCFANVLSSQEMESASFVSVVPSGTAFALSLPLNSQEAYLESYRKYLDASVSLAKNEARISELAKNTGISPDSWAKALNLKEIVKAQWRCADGRSLEALMLRVGRKDYSLIFRGTGIANEKDYSMSVENYAFPSFASALFGSFFALEDESRYVFTGEWLVSGSDEAVSDFAARYASGDVLQALLSDASVSTGAQLKNCTFAAYFSPGAAKMDELLAAPLLKAMNGTLDGASYEPFLLSFSKGNVELSVTRVPYFEKSSTPATVADATIDIPKGPFKVKNSGTGRTNLLVQQSNYYLSLKEEDGKGIWSIPFQAPLTGAVETIDYYANGKLQFLFTAGSKLYLLDRLGRFVSGFPVELGKEVLLGPAVYDFTGAHGYTLMVLHSDNTIGYYNTHGETPSSWKGISTDEKIIALPELLRLGGKSYWAIRTAVQTQIFPFNGGEAVYCQSGAKSIRRDSSLEALGNGTLRAVCNDGKTRNLKIQ